MSRTGVALAFDAANEKDGFLPGARPHDCHCRFRVAIFRMMRWRGVKGKKGDGPLAAIDEGGV
jgi:hypothetical protein